MKPIPIEFAFIEPNDGRTITATLGAYDGAPTMALFVPDIDGDGRYEEDLILIPISFIQDVLKSGADTE